MTFWPLTNSDFPTDQTFQKFHDLYTELDLHRIMSGFHGAFATGVASQQGTLTLPDTWFRPPFWDLLMLQLLRPNSSNLPCLYPTFHIEYPLVLSRFCSKQALIVCQKCARGFSLYFYSVKVSRVCDKVCQNSMIIFLFIYVYLKCVWIGIVFSWKEKVHEKEQFFHTKTEAWVCSGQYFISIIHVCLLLGDIQIILLNHACTNFLVFYLRMMFS